MGRDSLEWKVEAFCGHKTPYFSIHCTNCVICWLLYPSSVMKYNFFSGYLLKGLPKPAEEVIIVNTCVHLFPSFQISFNVTDMFGPKNTDYIFTFVTVSASESWNKCTPLNLPFTFFCRDMFSSWMFPPCWSRYLTIILKLRISDCLCLEPKSLRAYYQ